MKNNITLEKLAEVMQDGFESVNKKIDTGFEKMEQKFDGVGEEFVLLREEINERFDKVDTTMKHDFAEQSSRLTSVERRTTTLESK